MRRNSQSGNTVLVLMLANRGDVIPLVGMELFTALDAFTYSNRCTI